MMVFTVFFKMLRETVDPMGQEGDLYFGGPGIFLSSFKFFNYFGFRGRRCWYHGGIHSHSPT